MNFQRLKEAEASFLDRFPLGFRDPGMDVIRKRHNVDRLAEFARVSLTPMAFAQPQKFLDAIVTIIGRSSMVSRFEKAPFRDFIGSLTSKDKRVLTDAFEKRLQGRKKREGFDEIVGLLARHKLARWSIVSAVPFYLNPTREVFVKPTTAKKIVSVLEIDELHYHPRPDWAFYDGYRKLILEAGKHLDPTLTPNNAAITGLLMFSL
jgi:hypothetical protein